MTFSLHQAVVPALAQSLGAVSGLLDKAEAHCADAGVAPADLIGARLAPDMLPFGWQIKFVAGHSGGAIEGVRAGRFDTDRSAPPADFTGLRALLSDARAIVDAVDPADVDGFIGRDMLFTAGERRLPFVAEDYLLSFALPNLYFHAATAYDILRVQGVKLEKRDFLGAVRFRR